MKNKQKDTQNTKAEYQRLQNTDKFAIATLAGGCFWCIEAALQDKEGVVEVFNGYSGGEIKKPTYEQVSTGKTKYKEAVQIIFNPKKISYNDILNTFWDYINPTDSGGQFADRGSQYKTTIFYHDQDQKKVAQESKQKLEDSGHFSKPIATRILPYKNFYLAEEYHQDYYEKQTQQYKNYYKGSGRKEYVEKPKGKKQ